MLAGAHPAKGGTVSTTARTHRTIVAVAVAIFALTTTPAAVLAAPGTPPPGVQAQIDAYLAAAPTGVQINASEISFHNGSIVVTFSRTTTASLTADCPYNWFCLYDGVNFGYPRARFSSCGWQDLYDWNWHDRTESVYYNMPSGWVSFINHIGVGHSADVPIFSISTTKRSIIDVTPYRNTADHIMRYC